MGDVWKRTLASVPSTNASDPHGTPHWNEWDFSQWAPDAVVVNLGTNDMLKRRPQNTAKFNATLLALLQSTRSVYGASTHFFLACGPMDESYCDSVQWVVHELDVNTHFLDHRGFLNGTWGPACCGHPSARVDAAMASLTISQIQESMNW